MNPYRKIRVFIGMISVASAFCGCVENDLPYPSVTVNIASIKGEGFTVKELDVVNRSLVLALDECTDIRNVRIDSVAYSIVPHNVSTNLVLDNALDEITSSVEFPGTFDLRGPLRTTLSLFEDFEWAISAEQTIDRRFRVAGQVGKPVFDVANRTATAYVAKNADRSHVTIEELRLEPDGIATYSPTVQELTKKDFAESMRFVEVSCHGRTEQWMIYILPTDKNVEMPSFPSDNAWPGIIWLYGSGIEGEPMGFRYRKVSGAASAASGIRIPQTDSPFVSRADGEDADGEWLEVPADQITITGGSFKGYLNREPDTAYEIKAYCGDDETDADFIAAVPAPPQLPNGGFEEWSTTKDIVYPYAAGADPYWSTGNMGAALAKTTLTEACDPRPGSAGKYGAHLKSKFANVAGIGKFAAGNIFMGNYVATDGTNGLLTFGRSFTARPTALRLWLKFKGGVIDKAGKNTPAGIGVGSPDNGSIFIAVGTWKKEEYGVVPAVVPKYGGQTLGTDDSPICIATRDIGTLFKPNGPDVIGYGEYFIVDDIDVWTQVTIPLKYKATDIEPTNLLIVCASSRWGDYFTGSTQSEMWLDDLELVYDYVEPVD